MIFLFYLKISKINDKYVIFFVFTYLYRTTIFLYILLSNVNDSLPHEIILSQQLPGPKKCFEFVDMKSKNMWSELFVFMSYNKMILYPDL